VAVRTTVDETSEVLVVAQALLSSVGGEHEILKTFKGRELERVTYQRPLNYIDIPDAHFVILAEYVTTEDGTGLVHQAPAFGADDLISCRAYGLPVVNPVNPDGTFLADTPVVGGLFFKDADKPLVKELKAAGALYKSQQYEHSYPHCWRCHTALIYYAQPSWYIRTTQIKDALMRENEKTNWHPETIKNGRYGDWLTNNIDWALSRNRYWGTPLPIWRCENKHEVCIASLAELGELAGQELSNLDPHRPFVDDISFGCAQCSATMNRVPEVIDCWYDSGSMPFAQWGYPHKPGSVEKFENAYPADFICEAIDQTRGWFYTLMAIGTLVFDESSYKNVLCLGHILDKDGRKMSKHVGNVIEPMALMDQHGADAVRWYMLAAGSPWASRRVGHDAISDVVRKTLLTYWNTISFHALYAQASNFTLDQSPDISARSTMDKWILSELNSLVETVDHAYQEFDSQSAGKALASFIDDLSNWYVRRSRRRFWDGDVAALATLHECLRTLTQLLAPMIPFIAESAWQELIRIADPEAALSVHLTDFPISDSALINPELNRHVAMTRRVVELGRAARAESAIKIRQPLQRALISAQGWSGLPAEMREQISDELNVIELADIADADGDLVDISIKANFKSLGAKYGKSVQDIAKLLSASEPASLVGRLRRGESVVLESFAIELEDLVITEVPKSGWMVASNDGESVALDLTLTPELIAAGHVREVIRAVQERRKSDGFDISDRITVEWNSLAEFVTTISDGADHISKEVLATSFIHQRELALTDSEIGLAFTISRA
jgi:isoleucyl-tRNA synthetase